MKKKKFAYLFIEAACFISIYFIGLYLMAYMRIMEKLLSPSFEGGMSILLAAFLFLIVRMFLIVIYPGLFLARIFLIATKKK